VVPATANNKSAKEIAVVSGEEGMTPGPTGEELARAPSLHGFSVTARHVHGRGRTPGQAFLEEATAFGADLLIKGAYTQSRLRQLIFGGATRHIIMEATIPVLLAH